MESPSEKATKYSFHSSTFFSKEIKNCGTLTFSSALLVSRGLRSLAIFVRFLSGFCAVFVRFLCGSRAVFVRFLSGFLCVFLCGFCAVFVRFFVHFFVHFFVLFLCGFLCGFCAVCGPTSFIFK